MPEYRRADAPGASFFFTLVTHDRRPILTSPIAIPELRAAFKREREFHPFEIDAIVILPDHLHCIWTLPDGDTQFSMRWSAIKSEFTRRFIAAGGGEGSRSASRVVRNERGVWQRRCWEHVIRNNEDYRRHVDYIHYNPVRHGFALCPHDWPHSSFNRWVERDVYPEDWQCACAGKTPEAGDFDDLAERTGE